MRSGRSLPAPPAFGHGTVTIESQVPPPVGGRTVLSKQLAAAVKYGRRVTFHVRTGGVGPPLTLAGYLAGGDHEAYFLLRPNAQGVENCLVMRDRVVYLSIDNGTLLSAEPRKGELDSIIAPYRKHILETFFGQASSQS